MDRLGRTRLSRNKTSLHAKLYVVTWNGYECLKALLKEPDYYVHCSDYRASEADLKVNDDIRKRVEYGAISTSPFHLALLHSKLHSTSPRRYLMLST